MPVRRHRFRVAIRLVVIAFVVVALGALPACGSSGRHGAASTTTTAGAITRATSSTVRRPTTGSSTSAMPSRCVSTSEIDGWPVARRAAQLVVVPSLDFNVAALAPVIRSQVGGVLFLGTASPPADLRARLRTAAGPAAATRPAAVPLVMADVEGGGVQRLPGAVRAFPWPRDMAATMSVGQVERLAETVGRQMLRAGVGVDLAPVLDLDDRPGPSATNPDGRRSFGADPPTASAYGVAFMQGLRAVGVLPVVKHFPGLGGSAGNTDFGPAATLPYSELRAAGLQPFIATITAHAPAVMVSNASVPGLSSAPASLSAAVVDRLLRRQLGFSGLVVTDSLSAGAIRAVGDTVPQAAVTSIEAGADLVLFGSTLTPADTVLLSPGNVAATLHDVVAAVGNAVASGALPSTRLDQAVEHVLAAKGVQVC